MSTKKTPAKKTPAKTTRVKKAEDAPEVVELSPIESISALETEAARSEAMVASGLTTASGLEYQTSRCGACGWTTYGDTGPAELKEHEALHA